MPLFQKLRERFRDHARDDLCAGLRRLGMNAKLAQRGRPEERIALHADHLSLGIIDISQGPIRWINVPGRRSSPGGPI